MQLTMILQNENFHEFLHLYGLAYARHISNIFVDLPQVDLMNFGVEFVRPRF